MSRTVTLVILALEALVYLALCRSTASQSSAAYDETDHLMAGYVKLKRADFRFIPEHPHLAQVWAALPLAFMPVVDPWDCATAEQWRTTEAWPIGEQWLGRANPADRLLAPARVMISVLGLLLGAGVTAVAWRLGNAAPPRDERTSVGPAQPRGRTAAVAAGAVFALCPTMIAHGSVVTTDLAAALGVFGASLALAAFLTRPRLATSALAGIAAGAALLLKFSFIMVLPGVCAWWAISAWQRSRNDALPHETTVRRGVRALAGMARGVPFVLTALGCAWVFVWGCYGFRHRAAPAELTDFRFLIATTDPAPDQWAFIARETGRTGGLIRWAKDAGLIPEAFAWGACYTPFMMKGRASYFLGQTRFHGSWAYFPLLFLLKTPLPTLLLLGAGAAAWFRRRSARRAAPDGSAGGAGPTGATNASVDGNSRQRCWIVGAVCLTASYAACALASDFNTGHRHLTPLYPFLYVAAGLTAARMWHGARGDRLGLALLGGWLVVGAWRAHPDELAYFNEAIVRGENAAYVAVDSNIDWGQDVKKLAQLQRERGWPELKFSYFGSCDPGAYGVRATYLPSVVAPKGAKTATITPGVYAISLTCLRLAAINSGTEPWLNDWTPPVGRVYAELTQKAARAQRDPTFIMSADEIERWNNLLIARLFTRLRERPPTARAGRSIYVYEIDGDELARLTAP